MPQMEEDDNSTTVTPVNISISISPEVFNISGESEVGLVFTSYPSPILFPLSPPPSTQVNESEYVADSAVLGFTIPDREVKDLTEKIQITLQSFRAQDGMVSHRRAV